MTARGTIVVHHGDNREVLRGLADNSVDAIVTDPPYGLSDKTPDADLVRKVLGVWLTGRDVEVGGSGFMGRAWDAFVPGPVVWRECFRVLKPGGHLLAFFGTRTYDLGAIPIRLAGFEVRDLIAWLYGTGFPKSLDVSKAIDKAKGVNGSFGEPKSAAHAGWIERGRLRGDDNNEGWQRPWMDDPEAVSNAARRYIAGSPEAAEWEGWGTALKPALEPVVFARKPLIGTVAANVLTHGTGGLNIDACRVGEAPRSRSTGELISSNRSMAGGNYAREIVGQVAGRWPSNVVHDGSDEVEDAFPDAPGGQGAVTGDEPSSNNRVILSGLAGRHESRQPRGDSGSAARFFYSAKADDSDRLGSDHPTVKPIDLMAWLCRLVTPPGGTVLDPFAGTGSTGLAAAREGFDAILIEREEKHVADIRLRIEHAAGRAPHTAAIKARNRKPASPSALFGDDA
jgi:DNA modification methylase